MAYRSDRLARLVQGQHTSQVTDIEDQIADSVIGDGDSAFEDLIRRTLAAWVKAFGSSDQDALSGETLRRIIAAARSAVRRLLGEVAGRGPTALWSALAGALALGVEQGTAFVRAASGNSLPAPAVPRAARVLRDEALRIRELVEQRRDRALFLLHPDRVNRWSHLLAGLGAARAALPAVRAHVAWVINTAVSQGWDAVARATAPQRLWVSEADACVRCLAYTGRVVAVDEPFPGGLSWDPRQRRTTVAAVEGPPLHANCRCRAVPWNDAWTTSGIPFPLALRREAHRSIAYGRARPSESRTARIRAARELLRAEPGLLPAVEARARTAVREGRFAPAA
ncbi:hypothetical protein [Streptomyces stelliscabiei]|uniref:Uncharacterized protein n=1 Tax=Streptomyces stelliscabiei TaxID=146820 RepID=A0A8I0P6S3_9ACTN|nr:hypothetical protein [Streptomyces stelliscabiei]KND45374.1 hypothetical protein IQ64_07375 [Streptomyces stelliscabiei]MBE1597209.1 hypothetical protein [Streptomyces stelliscabiei]MDX2550128.1 hypothetical protein [Streptomyces stelliscabiei]